MRSGEEFQHEEQLENVELMPTQRDDRRAEELTERGLSEEIVEQQLNNIVAEFEPAVEWQVNATSDEVSMGDQIDLPFDLCVKKWKLWEKER
jgi:hypothetical protein